MIQNLIAHLLADVSVAAIAATRIHVSIAPEGTALPYVVVQQVSRSPDHHSGGPGLKRPLFQIDSYASTYASARGLGDAVEAAVDGFSGDMIGVNIQYAALESEQDIFDNAINAHRIRADFRLTSGS